MKQIPWFIVVMMIFGVLLSVFLVITQTNLIFKSGNFDKKIVLTPERNDAGYINLKRNVLTPSTLEWVKFSNGQTYKMFTTYKGEYIEEKVHFNVPESVERGTYYVDYEVRYLSGQVEKGTLSFTVFP